MDRDRGECHFKGNLVSSTNLSTAGNKACRNKDSLPALALSPATSFIAGVTTAVDLIRFLHEKRCGALG
jgi:hypothetical protein